MPRDHRALPSGPKRRTLTHQSRGAAKAARDINSRPAPKWRPLPHYQGARVMTHFIKTAEYFEGRARRARCEDERVRFLAAAQKYRDKALQDRTGTRRRDWTSCDLSAPIRCVATSVYQEGVQLIRPDGLRRRYPHRKIWRTGRLRLRGRSMA
jgi:hypothetical protein